MVKKWLKEYINKNIYDILIISIMIVIGVLVGVGVYLFSTEEAKLGLITSAEGIFELSRNETYVKANIISNGLQINGILLLILLIASVNLFGKQIIKIIAVLKGMAISIYAIVLFKIFGLGYGIVVVGLLVILVNLIYIPAFIYLLVIFLEINFNIFKTKVLSISILEKLGIAGRIIIAFICIFSSIVIEQIMSSVALSIYLKI